MIEDSTTNLSTNDTSKNEVAMVGTEKPNVPLTILYQDKYIVVINKPSGLLVHRSMIDKKETVFALQLLRDMIGAYVYPVHRLDKPTSGVLVFALDTVTAKLLNEDFKEHKIKKTYLSVVRGYTKDHDEINYDLKVLLDPKADKDRKTNKEPQHAITNYKLLKTVELPYAVSRYKVARYSLIELSPKTGRKHQLRRHMKHILHPMIGDTKYGRGEHNKLFREKFNVHRLLLHALSIEFIHPHTKESLHIQAPLDEVFNDIVKNTFLWEI